MKKIAFGGTVDPASGKANFIGEIDGVGKIAVPSIVRNRLGLKSGSLVNVSIEVVKEEESEKEKKDEREGS